MKAANESGNEQVASHTESFEVYTRRSVSMAEIMSLRMFK